jgi:hypothetical protein
MLSWLRSRIRKKRRGKGEKAVSSAGVCIGLSVSGDMPANIEPSDILSPGSGGLTMLRRSAPIAL